MPSHSTIPEWSPTVQVNITPLIDDMQWYQTVRQRRWPEGVACPSWASHHVITRGFADAEPARQRSACHDGDTRVEALTDPMFAGHHPPLKGWVLCLYCMGRNASHEPIGPAWALHGSDGQQRTAQRREGIVKKSPR
jgi:hypothetical protein